MITENRHSHSKMDQHFCNFIMFSKGQKTWIIINYYNQENGLNPLNLLAAEAEVNKKKPKTICDPKNVVEDYANQIKRDILHRVADNFMERVKFATKKIEYISSIF